MLKRCIFVNVNSFMKTKYTKKQIQESIKHWQKVLESLDIETNAVIQNAKANVDSINEMIAEIEKNGSTSLNSEILGSLVEFNDWCQEQMDKNGIS